MQADIDRGVCERRDCEEPYTHTVTWGGGAPAYACTKHAHGRRDSTPVVEPVENPHYVPYTSPNSPFGI